MTDMEHVCICLATYNGASFLEKQLKSFISQTHKDWSLLISDDGSTDATRNIIRKFINAHPEKKISLFEGPKKGYLKNFLSLICSKHALGNYFAFADQDDIWLPNKLAAALLKLKQLTGGGPKLYGARTIIIDACDNRLSLSPLFQKEPSFTNALVQNFSGGNTMLFNKEAREILAKAGWGIDVISHDWWAYLLISGSGGKIIYDAVPQVLYRSHARNAIGINQDITAKIKRLRAVAKGQYAGWNDLHVNALNKLTHLLTPENKNKLAQFSRFRSGRGLTAIRIGRKMGLYRLTYCGTLSLYIAGYFGKV